MEVLVDTTFLLPTLGVRVEEEAEEVIPLLSSVRVYYVEVSILEAFWKYVKLGADAEVFEEGLKAIRSTYELLTPGPRSYSLAMELYSLGHRDLIDDLIYASSRESGIHLLTIDSAFLDFLRDNGLPTASVLTPDAFKRLAGPASADG
ncbi:MAG: hypothetical protein DRO06_05115, partial [Thermoproteota archaeon]